MKLIHCNECRDVVSLRYEWRYCVCGQSGGHYVDNLNAEIKGPCTPLGFANNSFNHALLNQPEKDWGKEFNAFVIEKKCPTVKVITPIKCKTCEDMGTVFLDNQPGSYPCPDCTKKKKKRKKQ